MFIVTCWFIPLSKWVITLVISGPTPLIPFTTRVITHLLSGMNHQVRCRKTQIMGPAKVKNMCAQKSNEALVLYQSPRAGILMDFDSWPIPVSAGFHLGFYAIKLGISTTKKKHQHFVNIGISLAYHWHLSKQISGQRSGSCNNHLIQKNPAGTRATSPQNHP